MSSKKLRNHDFYGCYVANKAGYSKNYNFCLNYCKLSENIDYICLLGEKENYHKTNTTCLGYFVYDENFDTQDGLYNAIIYRNKKELDYYKKFFSQFNYVISMDYSTYFGLGKNIIINQITKSRLVCQWINENVNGCTCIPLITFSVSQYDDICLEGIVCGSAVAISIESCLKSSFMKERFDDIIHKTVDQIHPSVILIYSISVKTNIYEIFKYAIDNNIEIMIPQTKMKERNRILMEKYYGKRI